VPTTSVTAVSPSEFDITFAGALGNEDITGLITGGMGLTVNGAGLIAFNADNFATLASKVNLNAANVIVGQNNALGRGAVNTLTAASNLFTNSLINGSAITLSNRITLNHDLSLRGDRGLTLNGSVNGQGAANRTLTVNMEGSASVVVDGVINLATDTTSRDLIFVNNTFGSPLDVRGVIANGSGAIHQLRVGASNEAVVVSGNNTYTGGTVVAIPTVCSGSPGAMHSAREVHRLKCRPSPYRVAALGALTCFPSVPRIRFLWRTSASAFDVQSALEALSTIGASNVTVSGTTPGTSGGILTVTFANALAGVDAAQITANSSALTGTSAAIATATTVAGAAGPVVEVAQGGVLEIDGSSGAVNVTGKTLRLRASGTPSFGFKNMQFGSVRNVDGANSWTSSTSAVGSGALNLKSTDNADRQFWIGSDAGSLNIVGQISGTREDAANSARQSHAVVKTGAGTIRYSGAVPNLITGATTIFGGTLQLGKSTGVNALAGPVTVGDGGGAETLTLLGTIRSSIRRR